MHVIIRKSWENDVSESKIKNFFAKAGFCTFLEIEDQGELFSQIQQALENLGFKGQITNAIRLHEFLIFNKIMVVDYPVTDDTNLLHTLDPFYESGK